MIEPYDTVYIRRSFHGHNRYHRAATSGSRSANPAQSHCGRVDLDHCDEVPEIRAALAHEPCTPCFGVRGRRQRILNLIVVSGIPDGSDDVA